VNDAIYVFGGDPNGIEYKFGEKYIIRENKWKEVKLFDENLEVSGVPVAPGIMGQSKTTKILLDGPAALLYE